MNSNEDICSAVNHWKNATCDVNITVLLLSQKNNTLLPNIAFLTFGSMCYFMIWPFLVYDFKCIPFGRITAVLIGTLLMVVTLVLKQEEVYCILGRRNSLQTLCLLFGMMLFAHYIEREGLVARLLKFLLKKERSIYSILWLICLMCAILASVITNDATCVLMTPLILHEHQRQNRNKKEYLSILLGIATSANIGSAATIMGNPQNAYIAANMNINLTETFLSLLPAAVYGLTINTLLLYVYTYFIYMRNNTVKPKKGNLYIHQFSMFSYRRTNGVTSNSELNRKFHYASKLSSNRTLNLSNASDCGLLVDSEYRHNLLIDDNPTNHNNISEKYLEREPLMSNRFLHKRVETDTNTHQPKRICIIKEDCKKDFINSWITIYDPENLECEINDVQLAPCKNCILTPSHSRLFCCILLFLLLSTIVLLSVPNQNNSKLKFDLGLVPIGIGCLLLFCDEIFNKRQSIETIKCLDWGVILLFCGLFIWLEGFKKTSIPRSLFLYIKDYMALNNVGGVLAFTLFITIGSNILSNVPMVLLIVDYIHCLPSISAEQDKNNIKIVASLLLAWTSTIAGNFTIIGSVANIIVAEKAKREVNYNMNFFSYLGFGFISTSIILFTSLPLVYYLSMLVLKI